MSQSSNLQLISAWHAFIQSTQCTNLTKSIELFYEKIKETPAMKKNRKKVVANCQKIAERCLDGKVVVKTFGSFETGLMIPGSDIDVMVTPANVPKDKEEILMILKKLECELKKTPRKFWNVVLISNPSVPVVKYEDRSVPSHAQNVDISINSQKALNAVHILNHFQENEKQKQFKYIAVLVKFFLKRKKLNDVYSGGLSSYAICLLVISFLQRNPNANASLGELLTSFFSLYGYHFDFKNIGIDVRDNGKYIDLNTHPEYLKMHHLTRHPTQFNEPLKLFLLDPTDTSNNITKATFRMHNIQQEFREAFQCLIHTPVGTDPLDNLLGLSWRLDNGLYTNSDNLKSPNSPIKTPNSPIKSPLSPSLSSPKKTPAKSVSAKSPIFSPSQHLPSPTMPMPFSPQMGFPNPMLSFSNSIETLHSKYEMERTQLFQQMMRYHEQVLSQRDQHILHLSTELKRLKQKEHKNSKVSDNSIIEELQARINNLETELSSSQSKVDSLSTKKKNVQKKVSELDSRVKSLVKENSALQESIVQLDKKLLHEKEEKEKLAQKVEDCEHELQAYKDSILRLRNENLKFKNSDNVFHNFNESQREKILTFKKENGSKYVSTRNMKQMTPLYKACLHLKELTVKKVKADPSVALKHLSKGVDPERKILGTCLALASECNEPYLVEKLLVAGASVNFTSDSSFPPLFIAVENPNECSENMKIIQCLLNCREIDIFYEKNGENVFFKAIQLGRTDVLKELFKKVPKPDRCQLVNKFWKQGSNMLLECCKAQGDRIDVLKYLVDLGADINVSDASREEEIEITATPLSLAIDNQNLEIARYLADNLNYVVTSTDLLVAKNNNMEMLAKQLQTCISQQRGLSFSLSRNSKFQSVSPESRKSFEENGTIQEEKSKVQKKLKPFQRTMSAKFENDTSTEEQILNYMKSSRSLSLSRVKKMIKECKNVNYENSNGTILHHAIEARNVSIVHVLFEERKDDLDIDKRAQGTNYTPILLACSLYKNPQDSDMHTICELLCSAGADLNVIEDKKTCLLIAVQNGNVPLIDLLIAQPQIDVNLLSPITHAVRNSNDHPLDIVIKMVEKFMNNAAFDLKKYPKTKHPLYFAIQSKNCDLIKLIVKKDTNMVNLPVREGNEKKSMFMVACELTPDSDAKKVVACMLHHAAPKLSLIFGDNHALMCAKKKKNYELIKMLLSQNDIGHVKEFENSIDNDDPELHKIVSEIKNNKKSKTKNKKPRRKKAAKLKPSKIHEEWTKSRSNDRYKKNL